MSTAEKPKYRPISGAARSQPPTAVFAVAALGHAFLLVWGIAGAGQPALELPYGTLLTVTSSVMILAICAIGLYAKRSSLTFVVVPAMLTAGISAQAVWTVASDPGIAPATLARTLGFGTTSVAITLSMGASIIAARVVAHRGNLGLGGVLALKLGVVAMMAVVGAAAAAERLAPLALVFSMVGVLSVAGVLASYVSEPRGSAMAELVSVGCLSLGSVWAACIAAGSGPMASAGGDWSPVISAMRYGWLAALPLVLSIVVALYPRVRATGIAVKRARSNVLATGIGAFTCVAMSQAVLIQSSHAVQEAHASTARAEQARLALEAKRARERAQPKASPPRARAPAEDDLIVLHYSAQEYRLEVNMKIDGPLPEKDAKDGVAKGFERLMKCYEESEDRGSGVELQLRLTIDETGSVKQADAPDDARVGKTMLTCIQLAFYRSGFASAPRTTWLDVSLSFVPEV